jgi:RNA polymerase sigma factor (sigma-70 family)
MNSVADKSNLQQYTQLLFPYAYNILGSAEEAKDAVQDVLLKHFSSEDEHIQNEKNYLIRSVINRSIDIKSRLKRIVDNDAPWLPEPVATEDAADRNLYLKDILSYSLLVLMERLGAKERAVFILRETFDYSHSEIAEMLDITEEHSRKLYSRGKSSLFKPGHKRNDAQLTHDREVLSRFVSAIRQGDIEQLENAMTEDIRFYADGGGKVPVAATVKIGASAVAALQVDVYKRYLTSARFEYATINHQPALLIHLAGKLTACEVFDLEQETGKILRINTVLDPDKLKSLVG